MPTLYAILLLAGLWPLVKAWRANRTTSLFHAIHWGLAAWLAWCWALLVGEPDWAGLEPARYIALSLTACAGVAVLGARRPQVVAWNFVVVGLLAVMLLPLAEGLVLGTDPIDPLRIFFVSATLGVGVLNYLPTRYAPAAFLLGLAGAGELLALFAPERLPGRGELPFIHLLLLAVPWVGWACRRGPRSARSEFDTLWLDFRDRLGLLWGQRVREQFNAAAANAGWPVRLYWQGLLRHGRGEVIAPDAQEQITQTLRAVLRRFQD
jgi:hypothetical protein